jgi:hypothetical protein
VKAGGMAEVVEANPITEKAKQNPSELKVILLKNIPWRKDNSHNRC